MSELVDIQKILNDDSGSFSTLEYQLAERVEKAEQQRDIAIERAAHWKDQHDKAMQYGKSIEQERDEAIELLREIKEHLDDSKETAIYSLHKLISEKVEAYDE